MIKIGLTGSIGVGKSFVADTFRQLGCFVLDADQTARAAVLPGTVALSEIVVEFGPDVLTPEGTLDRAHVGELVFADATRRARLNQILHPRIVEMQDAWLRKLEADQTRSNRTIAIIDAALMIEAGSHMRFDKIIVVHCAAQIHLQRIVARDKISGADAQRRIDAQMSQQEKMKFADYLIDTSDGFESTAARTQEVYRLLMQLAEKHEPDASQ